MARQRKLKATPLANVGGAEDQPHRHAEESNWQEQQRAYKPLPAQSLEDLRRRTPFAEWAEYVEPATLRRARSIIRGTIDALIELGPHAPEPLRMDEFHHCVECFNMLEEEEGCIETIEREDICELISELAALVDLDDYGEALTSRRDW
jgi:hypothetical protein